MGTVVASSLVTRVRELTEHDLPELLADASILALLNEAYAELWQAYPWPQSVKSVFYALAVGDAMDLPADFRSVHSVSAGVLPVAAGQTPADALAANGVPELHALRQRTFPQDWFVTTGTPIEFTVVDGDVEMWPEFTTPMCVNVKYLSAPEQFADMSGVWAFHDEFAPALAYAVAARVLAQEADDSGRIAVYQREYEALVQRMRLTYLNEVVRPFSFGGDPVRVANRRGRRRVRGV